MSYLLRTGLVAALALLGAAAISAAETAKGAVTEAAEQGSVEAVKQETSELLQSLQAYGANQRDQAVAATKAALERTDEQIDLLQARLDSKWGGMSEAARKRTKESMQALREQRTKVEQAYEQLSDASADAWDDVKEGFSEAYLSLAAAWDDSARAIDDQDQ